MKSHQRLVKKPSLLILSSYLSFSRSQSSELKLKHIHTKNKEIFALMFEENIELLLM